MGGLKKMSTETYSLTVVGVCPISFVVLISLSCHSLVNTRPKSKVISQTPFRVLYVGYIDRVTTRT